MALHPISNSAFARYCTTNNIPYGGVTGCTCRLPPPNQSVYHIDDQCPLHAFYWHTYYPAAAGATTTPNSKPSYCPDCNIAHFPQDCPHAPQNPLAATPSPATTGLNVILKNLYGGSVLYGLIQQQEDLDSPRVGYDDVNFNVCAKPRCSKCTRELCAALDTYYGKDPAQARLCSTCRRN